MAKNPLSKTTDIFELDTNLMGLFKFNLFSENVEYTRTPVWDDLAEAGKSIDDDDIINMRYYLTKVHDWEPNPGIVGEVCYLVSRKNQYHPVKDFIEKEDWDGVERLGEWLILATGCDDNIYTREVSRKILVAAANRVYHPGCKFDHMVILEGDQGIGKSTMVEELVGDFYLDTTFEHRNNDLVDSICQAMIVEISELSGMTKKDVDWMKGFITRKVDRIRLPYARRTKDFKRRCIFIGTYNPSGNNSYFRDDTGNRRFWPIECGKIDVGYIRKNRAQLWAEARVRCLNKEKYYIDDPEALKIMVGMHQDRELESPTFIKIRDWLNEYPRDHVSMMTLIEDCLKINTDGKMPRDLVGVSSPIGIIMKRLGWRKGTNENRDKYYPPDGFKKGEWDE